MLSSLLLSSAGAAAQVEISLGMMPEPLSAMMSMMEDLAAQTEVRRPMPRNPCAEDQQRLQCTSAACLMSNLQSLSPQCAALLKGRQAEPSPAPTMASPQLGFFAEFMLAPDVEMTVEEFSPGALPAEFGGLLDVLPAELAQFFAAPPDTPSPRAAAPKPVSDVAEHPCKAEVERCISEEADTSNAGIHACLEKHLDDPGFSSKCKCFLHQMDSTSRKSRPSVGPSVRVVAITDDEFRPHPMRHAFCMIFMPMLVITLAITLRRCCLCFCTPKPQLAAVVPPEQATIKTVEPLIFVTAKEQA